MRIFLLTTLSIVAWSGLARAESGARGRLLGQAAKIEAPPTQPLPELLMVDGKGNLPAKSASDLLPNRVYVVNVPAEKRWIFVLANFEGRLPEPLEGLRGGTVLPGWAVGAKKPKQRYLLLNNGVWVPTFQEEQQYFWVRSTPPRIKAVTFYPVGKGK